MLIEKPRIPIRDILLFGLWPSFIKVWLYRLKGYRIGKGVSIGLGSVICGDRVEIGEHTSIGFLTIVRGKEIRIGAHVKIGSTTFLDTPYIQIGEGSRINEQVFIGGLQFPDSRFVLGRNSMVQQLAFINPAKSVVIGDDSSIGGHSLIFGHTSWLSQFEGYPVDFEPIEIGNSVGIGWRVFVLPGSKIEDGVQVGANSLVRGTIPPRCLAIGFPARVVSKFPEFPKDLSEKDKLEIFRKIIAAMVSFFVQSGLQCDREGGHYVIAKPATGWIRRKRGSWKMVVAESDVRDAIRNFAPGSVHVFLSLLDIPDDIRELLRSHGIMWIDIAKKEQSRRSNELGDEVSNFLKRYGVRTFRIPALSSPVS